MDNNSLGVKIKKYSVLAWFVGLIIDVIALINRVMNAGDKELLSIFLFFLILVGFEYIFFMYFLRGVGQILCNTEDNGARLKAIEEALSIGKESADVSEKSEEKIAKAPEESEKLKRGWTCPYCGTFNYSDTIQCSKCFGLRG